MSRHIPLLRAAMAAARASAASGRPGPQRLALAVLTASCDLVSELEDTGGDAVEYTLPAEVSLEVHAAAYVAALLRDNLDEVDRQRREGRRCAT